MNEHYVKVQYVHSAEEYNRFAKVGWRYITYQRVAEETAAGNSEYATLILGWPEGAGDPVYPEDPSWITT